MFPDELPPFEPDEERRALLRTLYPTFTEEQIAESERNLDAYARIRWRMAGQMQSDPELRARFYAAKAEHEALLRSRQLDPRAREAALQRREESPCTRPGL